MNKKTATKKPIAKKTGRKKKSIPKRITAGYEKVILPPAEEKMVVSIDGLPPVRYEADGFVYCPEIINDFKKDIYKVTHYYANKKTGAYWVAEFTPYMAMSKIDFQNFVAADFPSAPSHRPLSSGDLRGKKNGLKGYK